MSAAEGREFPGLGTLLSRPCPLAPDPALQDFGLPAFRHCKHPFAEIQPDDLDAALRQRQGQISSAAAQVQRAFARPWPRQPDEAPFPIAVQAETLEIVEPVVAGGDAAKQVLHLRRPLFPRFIEWVGHAQTLRKMALRGDRNLTSLQTCKGFLNERTAMKLVLLSPGLTGFTHELKADRTTIGRSEDNLFHVADPSVSSHHCEVLQRQGELLVRDLHSTNGTYINGEEVTEKVIKPGQILRLGKIEMRLETSDVPAPSKEAFRPHNNYSRGRQPDGP